MIATETVFSTFIKLVAPIVWKKEERIAEKLLDFAATESGSALDMFAAAELTADPKLRRLFFRHALDEAKHARMFERAAKTLVRSPKARRWSSIHATRQNLYKELGEVDFLAFVHLAEKAGEAHFRALAEHFRDRKDLSDLLARIAKDEVFHVRYSERALRERHPDRAERALIATRARGLWQAWRRQGRVIGDLVGRSVLHLVFLFVVPFFALALRFFEPEQIGWKEPRRP
jgi:rubrerythrin